LIVLVVSSGLIATILWQGRLLEVELPTFQPSGSPARQSARQSTPGGVRRIRLFFPQESGETLVEETREIQRQATLSQEVRATLQQLIHPDLPGARSPLPSGTEIRQVFVDGFGIAYLDFGRPIQSLGTGPGGTAGRAISALVTSLTTSFREIERVQFLVEGEEMILPLGGVDLRRPLRPWFPEGGAPSVPAPPRD
jgi:spore germination protein GerM